MILAIAATFIAGMLVSAPQVFAPGVPGDSLVATAIDNLATIIQGKDTAPVVNLNSIVGPEGPEGEQGIQGPPGPVANFKTYSVSNSGSIQVEVQCDPGDLALAGGFIVTADTVTSSQPIDVNDVYTLIPDSTGIATGWRIIAAGGVGFSDVVIVHCYDNPPLRSSLPPIVVIP